MRKRTLALATATLALALSACSTPPPNAHLEACKDALDKSEEVMLLSSDAITTLAGTDSALVKIRALDTLIDKLEPAMSEYVDAKEECLNV